MMRIINQSRFPDDEVATLIRFGFRGVYTTGVVVKVKNTRKAYRGMAYHGVPTMSPEYGKLTARQLVTIAIGPDTAFPIDNLHERVKTVRKIEVHGVDPGRGDNPYQMASQTDEAPGEGEEFGGVHFSGNRCCAQVSVIVRERMPYGGKGSPKITLHNWREALVTVAAHEARHVWQGQRKRAGKRQAMSEVDAECHAGQRLSEYRANGVTSEGVLLG